MMNVCISVGVCGYYGWVLLTVAPRYLKLNLHLKIVTFLTQEISNLCLPINLNIYQKLSPLTKVN